MTKRSRKIFPPGTFIPTPARVVAILQLCLALSLLLWISSRPFFGELFTVKADLLLYQEVMGIPSSKRLTADELALLKRNESRFEKLPLQQKKIVIATVKSLEKRLSQTWTQKMATLGQQLLHEYSPFTLSWLTLALFVSILLLKKIEGAVWAAWLLPLVVALGMFEQTQQPQAKLSQQELALFPKESDLTTRYLEKPLSAEIDKQREELQLAWQRYLIREWLKEEPAATQAPFLAQAEEGQFRFSLARIEARQRDAAQTQKGATPLSWLNYLFLAWNLLFALVATRYCR